MNMESIVQRCTEKFSNNLREALEEAERQGAEGVKVEIKIHIGDEDEPFTETEATEDAEDAEDMRERQNCWISCFRGEKKSRNKGVVEK